MASGIASCCLTLASLVLLVGAGKAEGEPGGDVAGSAATTATLPLMSQPTSAVFEFPGDSDWYKVKLKAGLDYAVSVGSEMSEGSAQVSLRDPKGKILASATESPVETVGFSYRAAKSGTYFLEYRAPAAGIPVPLTYRPYITGDCRPDIATTCALDLDSFQARQIAYAGDVDAFRLLQVQAGRVYTLRLITVDIPWYAELEVKDPLGRSVGSVAGNVVLPDGTHGLTLSFATGSAGNYLAVVGSGEDSGALKYLLVLNQEAATAARR